MKYALKMDCVQYNNYWYDRFTTSGLKLRQDFVSKIEYSDKSFKTATNTQRLSNLNTDFKATKLIVKVQTQNLEAMTRGTNFVFRV